MIFRKKTNLENFDNFENTENLSIITKTIRDTRCIQKIPDTRDNRDIGGYKYSNFLKLQLLNFDNYGRYSTESFNCTIFKFLADK